MLKKAGIVVATAAAGLLAVSPLAFAGDKGYHHDDHHKGAAPSHSHTTVNDHTTTYDHSPTCSSAPQAADNSANQSALGASGLLALLGGAANLATPVNAQTQAPILSCNNLQDIANVNVSDNFQDNSESRTNVNRSFND